MLQITYGGDDEDYYAMIGCKRSDPIGAIKRAINRAQTIAHPDHGGNPLAFARVAEARQMLLNPVNRRIYDETGLRMRDIVKIAEEFVNNVLPLYAKGFDNEKVLTKTLYEAYKGSFEEQQKHKKTSQNTLKITKQFLEEIEDSLNNIFMQSMYETTAKKIRELNEEIVLMDENLKELRAKMILSMKLTMKTKDPKVSIGVG